MAVTQAQVNSGKALILDRAFLRYPEYRAPLVRLLIQAIKNGTAAEKEVGKAILNQAYQVIFGESATSTAEAKHKFKHWLADHSQAQDTSVGQIEGGWRPVDPTPVSITDIFEAEEITVT